MKRKTNWTRSARMLLAIAGMTTAVLAVYSKVWVREAKALTPVVVKVSVVVGSSGGGTLKYQWRATDGTIVAANAASTTWTLPDGPGIHFAYVLVSNGKGGYTERRIAVNSDPFGNPLTIPPPTTLAPPAAGVPAGGFYRSFIEWGSVAASHHGVKAPNLPVYVLDVGTGKHYPPTGTVSTDVKGQFLIPHVPAVSNFQTECSTDGGATFNECTTNGPTGLTLPGLTVTDYVYGTPLTTSSLVPSISGSLVLQDGTPCGTQNEFFGVHVGATATLLDSFGVKLAGPVNLDDLGEYSLPYNASAASVSLKCQGAAALKVPITGLNPTGVTDIGQAKLPGISAPTVTNMTALLGSTSVGTFKAPPTGLPSDIVPSAAAFLAEKGLDTRVGACQYYKAIGAVTTCDASGNPTGAISFDDWQRMVKIGKYASGATEYIATYVNKVDLNLTREHHSISYGPSDTAAYVCNHAGPTTDSQADVNTAIANTVAGKALVACVAMDYAVHAGVNGGKPFTRFYIFGPSEQLLLSINLDQRREKFVPGTCIVCHGGDKYAGKFSTAADVGGHFLPYDTGNFEFSTTAGLTEANQETAIYSLNQNVLQAGPTAAETSLITGWYGSGKVLNKTYLPPSWAGKTAIAQSFYRNVLARSCRTCHTAMVEGYNFDHYANITPDGPFFRGEDASLDVGVAVCGGEQVIRAHSMPNSLETFNRFWGSSGTSVDQPKILGQFLGSNVSSTGKCTPGLLP